GRQRKNVSIPDSIQRVWKTAQKLRGWLMQKFQAEITRKMQEEEEEEKADGKASARQMRRKMRRARGADGAGQSVSKSPNKDNDEKKDDEKKDDEKKEETNPTDTNQPKKPEKEHHKEEEQEPESAEAKLLKKKLEEKKKTAGIAEDEEDASKEDKKSKQDKKSEKRESRKLQSATTGSIAELKNEQLMLSESSEAVDEKDAEPEKNVTSIDDSAAVDKVKLYEDICKEIEARCTFLLKVLAVQPEVLEDLALPTLVRSKSSEMTAEKTLQTATATLMAWHSTKEGVELKSASMEQRYSIVSKL
ncbi:hypothetical protein RFI_38479, partial [Reticulomyxa filosa]